jgi:putative membrane protein
VDSIPYCGQSPIPGTLGERWNFDPFLLAALTAVVVLYAARVSRARSLRDPLAFFAGWSVVAVTLVSPLCALAVALFSARMGQHLLLALVAAPLLVYGCVDGNVYRSRRVRHARDWAEPLLGSLMFAACWWLWHAPGPYQAALRNDSLYVAMQLSLLASACALWRVLLGSSGLSGSLLAGLWSAMHMGVLGALLTLAPEPLYAHHVVTAPAWSFSALEDQQLAGLLCWVPGCGVFALVALVAMRRVLAEGSCDAICTNELQEAQ